MQMSFLTSQDGKAVWFQATLSVPPAALPGRRGSAFWAKNGNTNKCGAPAGSIVGTHTLGFFLELNPMMVTDLGSQLSQAACGTWL